MLDWFSTHILEFSRFEFFIGTLISFYILYFTLTIPTYFFLTKNKKFVLVQNKPYRPKQIQREIKSSLFSILMFGVLSFWMYQGLHSGFFKIIFAFDWKTFLTEVLVLFLWNDLHFYLSHRFLHFKIFYKYHVDHHYSFVPSPFSAYSFHWVEGLILGAVMPMIMCIHDFQFYSLLSLPVFSLLLNVLGHSNVDFFPNSSIESLLSFSKRHSLHHKVPHTNFGFFLPYFDRLFRTDRTT